MDFIHVFGLVFVNGGLEESHIFRVFFVSEKGPIPLRHGKRFAGERRVAAISRWWDPYGSCGTDVERLAIECN